MRPKGLVDSRTNLERREKQIMMISKRLVRAWIQSKVLKLVKRARKKVMEKRFPNRSIQSLKSHKR